MRLFREVAALLAAGEDIVIATLFDKTGSAPRTAGAKMVVRADGRILGTIGGGCLEAETIAEAKKLLKARQSAIRTFELTGNETSAADMVCGGAGEILINFVEANASNRRIYEEAAATLSGRRRAWLITSLGRGEPRFSGWQCLVKHDHSLVGDFPGAPDSLAKLLAGPAKLSIHAEVLEGQRFLVEPLRPPATVYIFGAGHVSQQIVPLCELVGFRTVVIDDRPEYATPARFTPRTEVLRIESFSKLPPLPIDSDSYLVIVTKGHLHDKTVLEQVLGTSAAYIGMIGSRRKRESIFAALLNQGFTADVLRRVHSPIGIDILAETPEEIAVSIVSELIRVRAERSSAQN